MNATQPDGKEIIRATEAGLPAISELAGVIWRACYPGIITSEQIDYMLARMYSLDVLRDEIRSQGIRYDRLLLDGELAGFASYGPTEKMGVFNPKTEMDLRVAATPSSQKVVATPRRLSENHPPFETWKNAPGAAPSLFGDAASPPQPPRPASVFEFKLHKLYLLPELHGRGLGSRLLQHVEREVRTRAGHRLMLSVNKRNAKAIAAYQRNGFRIVESVVTDIGGGFVMDDYIMAKELAG
jgi:GNAT superfamily N-acetyltransferase